MVDRDTALAAFLRAFGEERYFEAHELLEEYWMSYDGPDREFYKGLIQSAVALHHATHGNPDGARGVGERARGLLAPYASGYAGVDVRKVLQRLAAVTR